MENWLNIYKTSYKDLLSVTSGGEKRGLLYPLYDRSEGFQKIFELLLSKKNSNFQIIETGTLRNPGKWKEGNSGFLFSEFVKFHGGLVRSVDIDQKAVDTANNYVDQNYFKAYQSDSVKWLQEQKDLSQIDLFYLDSYDVKWQNDDPSAQHHLKEFLAIEPHLKNCIVAIDDNSFLLNGQRTGKGRAIYNYLKNKSIEPLYDNYQIIYKF